MARYLRARHEYLLQKKVLTRALLRARRGVRPVLMQNPFGNRAREKAACARARGHAVAVKR